MTPFLFATKRESAEITDRLPRFIKTRDHPRTRLGAQRFVQDLSLYAWIGRFAECRLCALAVSRHSMQSGLTCHDVRRGFGPDPALTEWSFCYGRSHREMTKHSAPSEEPPP